jgi:hypothetical protein
VAQGEGPEFKFQYHTHTQKKLMCVFKRFVVWMFYRLYK